MPVQIIIAEWQLIVLPGVRISASVYICDRAWENRPLCYNFRFRDIGTTLKRAIHSMQWSSQNRDSVYRSRVTRVQVQVPEKSFLAENGANLRKVSFRMFSVYYICSRYDVTCTDIGSSTCTSYISPSTMIANGTKIRSHICQEGIYVCNASGRHSGTTCTRIQ